jgi:hypothetical protein
LARLFLLVLVLFAPLAHADDHEGTGESRPGIQLFEERNAALKKLAKLALKDTQARIKESLKRRGIDAGALPPIQESYAILVGDFPRADLESDERYEQIRSQIREAALFLQNFFIDTLGQTDGLFQFFELEIGPKQEGSSEPAFQQKAKRLLLKLGKEVRTESELRADWDRGAQLPKSTYVSRAWPFVNPVGEFQTNVKDSLLKNAKKLAREIEELTAASEAPASEGPSPELAQTVRGLLERATQGSELPFAFDLSKLESLSHSQLTGLLKGWGKRLTDTRNVAELSEAVAEGVQASEQAAGSKVDVKIKGGWVAVGNYHNIRVQLGAASPETSNLVKIARPDQDIKADVEGGLVAVYTIDNVSVSVDLKNSIESLALMKTLQQLPSLNGLLKKK